MKFLKVVLASAMSVSLLAGCGGSSSSSSSKVFKVAKLGDIMTLDSTQAYDTTSIECIHMMNEGLMGVDAKGNMVKMFAKSYKESKDGKHWTFKLRDGLKWTDTKGKTYPLKASDFVYSWRKGLKGEYNYIISDDGAGIKNATKIINKGTKATAKDYASLGIKAPDDKTLKITLERPCPYFLDLMTYSVFYPQCEEFVEKAGKNYANAADHLISCGAFMPTSWTKSSQITFKKNKNYYNAKIMKIDGVQYLLGQDVKAASASFASGKIDFTAINSSLVDKYKNTKDYRVDKMGFVYYLNFNFTRKTMANKNIRAALSYAINRDDFCKNILKDGSIKADGIVGRDMCFNPTNGKDFRDENGNFTNYDMKKAQAYLNKGLKELGKKSVTIQLLYSTNENPGPQIAQYLQNAFSKLKGLKIDMKATVRQGRIDLQAKKQFDMTILNWGPDYNDPTTYLNIALSNNSNNRGFYKNKKYDALLHKAAATTDKGARWKLLLKAEKMFNEDYVDVPLYQMSQSSLYNHEWKGLLYKNAMGAAYTYTYMYKA